MIKTTNDALAHLSFERTAEVCQTNELVHTTIKKYAIEFFKFKMDDETLVIKTISSYDRWSIASQSRHISKELQDLTGKLLKVKCEVVPKL